MKTPRIKAREMAEFGIPTEGYLFVFFQKRKTTNAVGFASSAARPAAARADRRL